MNFVFCILLIFLHTTDSMSLDEIHSMREHVRSMFIHAYDSYIRYAFPHDELKPITKTYTDSLGELGGAKPDNTMYNGVAMTLIDTLDTLALMGNWSEFELSVYRIINYISDFDIDLRVNMFEVNIRLLGGLLSAHIIASDPNLPPFKRHHSQYQYNGELLTISHDLGNRLLPAFKTKSGIPYAWINLRNGLNSQDTHQTCVACAGSLLIEFGVLSYLTGDTQFYTVAYRALTSLWQLRSKIGLIGNSLHGQNKQWINRNSGIGAGVDSWYEYLLKSYILFGDAELLDMFTNAYDATQMYLKKGSWYVEVDMNNGRVTRPDFNSLQAFFPGLQCLYGDVTSAIETQEAFFSLWNHFGVFPDRFSLSSHNLLSSEKGYPLRPELAESTYMLFLTTKEPRYLEMGKNIINSLDKWSYVSNGFTAIQDVSTMKQEDYMPSFFLSETCKYLYLLFDPTNFIHQLSYNHIFNTEGHIFFITPQLSQKFLNSENSPVLSRNTHLNHLICTDPVPFIIKHPVFQDHSFKEEKKSTNNVEQNTSFNNNNYEITNSPGSFHLLRKDTKEIVDIHHLGTDSTVIINRLSEFYSSVVIAGNKMIRTKLNINIYNGEKEEIYTIYALPAFFGPELRKPLTSFIEIVNPISACSPFNITKNTHLKNKIALILRGNCTFVEKVLNVQNSGAIAVIMGNDVEDTFRMGYAFLDNDIIIPSLMITRSSYDHIFDRISLHDQTTTKISNITLSTEHQTILQTYNNSHSFRTNNTFPHVSGVLTNFDIYPLGGWRINIELKKQLFYLKIYEK